MPPVVSKPRRALPHPSWKTSTSTPYAAATESRLSNTALTAMTSDLNVTSIKTSASSSTNANTSGAVVFIWLSKSRVWAVIPVTATSASSREPTVAGTMSSRRASSAAFGRSVAAVPGDRDGDHRDRALRVDAHVDRLVHHLGGHSGVDQLLDPRLYLRRLDVGGLDHHVRRDLGTGESGLELVVGGQQVLRERVDPRLHRRHLESRGSDREQQPTGEHHRDSGAPKHPVQDRAPEAALAVPAAKPAGERHAATVHPVAQLGEHRGSTVREPSMATATTIIVAIPNEAKVASASAACPTSPRSR